MSLLETLVVGVDGTATSSAALVWAADQVGASGSVLVTHARPPRAEDARPSDPGDPSDPSDKRPDRLEPGSGLDQSWIDPVRIHTCSVRAHVVNDHPAEALLRTAERAEADAIVVGPHSGECVVRALGRVTRRLLQRSTIPLIVVRVDPDTELGRGDDPGPVVACVGYGDATETAALWAADFAAQQGLPLKLLHVVGYRPMFPADSPSEVLASYLGPDLVNKWAAEDLDEIQERISIRQPDLAIDTAVDVGLATRAILKASVGAALVVLGKRQTNVALQKMISPRIHQLIAKSPTTVAVVPSCSTEP